MAMQMHDVDIGRRNEGIEIGKPFQPRPGMMGAVNAQISKKIVLPQSADAQAIGNDDILRRRTGVNLLEQLGIIGDAPLQFRERTMDRMDECDFPGIAHDSATLCLAEMACRKRKRITVTFEKRHGGQRPVRRDQKIDVVGVLHFERAVGELRQRNAL